MMPTTLQAHLSMRLISQFTIGFNNLTNTKLAREANKKNGANLAPFFLPRWIISLVIMTRVINIQVFGIFDLSGISLVTNNLFNQFQVWFSHRGNVDRMSFFTLNKTTGRCKGRHL